MVYSRLLEDGHALHLESNGFRTLESTVVTLPTVAYPMSSYAWTDRVGITKPDIPGQLNLSTLASGPIGTGNYDSLVITADSTVVQTIGLAVALWDERGNPFSVSVGTMTLSGWAKNAAGNFIPQNSYGLNPPGFINVDVSMASAYAVLVQSMLTGSTINLHWKLF